MKTIIEVRTVLLMLLVLAVALGAPLTSSATPTVSLSPSVPSPQPVGTVITWTATASDSDPGTLLYAFNVGPHGGTLALVRDFGYSNKFQSYPALQEGNYQVEVTVRNNTTLKTATTTQSFIATAIATSSDPVVISATSNALVALFSGVPCPAGDSMVVAFKNASQTTPQVTPAKPCNSKSMNFLVAGMTPTTPYSMTGEYISSTGTVVGHTSTATFTTGSIPSSVLIPTITTLSPAPAIAASEPFLIHSYLFSGQAYSQAGTDLNGNVIWYYQPWDGAAGYIIRAQTGGFFWYAGDPFPDPYNQVLREFDVAGNTVIETNVGRVNEQLVAAGQPALTDVDHELRTMGNGDILMIGSLDKIFGPGVQGGADILFNELVVLNPSMQLAWSWNSTTCGNCSTQLPLSREAVLGETCVPGQGGCPPLTPPNTIANDWLHGNSAELAPDGSILMSLRHQDWLLKIDYNNGTGTGNILWRMGLDGDFTIVGDANDTYPWFSHQHDAEWDFTTSYLSVFDNGNTRIAANPTEHSRGQLLNINQSTMVATLVANEDIGQFCNALGTAQMLVNQNQKFTGLHFECGSINFTSSQSQSFYSSGFYNVSSGSAAYRSAQMHDMYSPYVGAN